MKYLLLILVLSGCSAANTDSTFGFETQSQSFAQRQVRYMTPFDLMRLLRATFGPDADERVPGSTDECSILTDSNRGILGDSSAASGSPVFSEPSSNFVRWYVGCVNEYTQLMGVMISRAPAAAFKFWGPTLLAHPEWQTVPFTSIPQATRIQVIGEQIERMIGPSDIIADFGYFASSEDLAKKIETDITALNLSANDSMKRILLAIAIRDEFMSY